MSQLPLISLITSSLEDLGVYLSRNSPQEQETEIDIPKVIEATKEYVVTQAMLDAREHQRNKIKHQKSKALADRVTRALHKKKKVKYQKTNNPIEEVFVAIRTEDENEQAQTYEPQNTVTEEQAASLDTTVELLQEVSDIIETHIVASTINKDSLKAVDYTLDGLSFMSVVLNQAINDLHLQASSTLRPDSAYSYNFRQAHRITSVFNKRYKLHRPSKNSAVIHYDIRITNVNKVA